MDLTQNLLSYWYNLEFFAPFWPEKTKDTTYVNAENKRLIWLTKVDTKYTYDVYLGKIKSQDLIVGMLEAIDEKDDTIEKDSSQSCLCAFKLTSGGTYIESSFSVSTFVWAISKIITEKNLRAEFNPIEIDKLNSEINDILLSMNNKIEYRDLGKIFSIVTEKVRIKPNTCTFSAVINKKFAKKEDTKRKAKGGKEVSEKDEEDNDIDVNTDMMSSFYVSDIDMVKRNVQTDDRIVQYIKALKNSQIKRIEIDSDVPHMKRWLSPDKYPLGKWPSSHSPSLMQQMAINIAISEDELPGNIFSVNGPPGTGKTTLLKEIIASNLVERALLLCEYQKPGDAFLQCQFEFPENEYLKYFYQLDSKLNKYGIIVASNNNAAVENISKELPIAKDVKKSNTRLFNIDENKEIYFSDIAKTLMVSDEECWGLISARLGKKSNINELKQALWFNKEGVNLQQLYKEELPNWEEAKTAFRNKHSEVLNYRRVIEEAVESANRHKQLVKEYSNAKNEVAAAKGKVIEEEDLFNQKEKEQNKMT